MIPSKNEPPVYNSILFNNYLRLFRSKYPNIDTDDLLDYSGIERYEVEDPLQWLTQTQHQRFFEWISDNVGNTSKIAREAGNFIYSEISLGFIKYLSLNILGVGNIYKFAAKYANQLTKATLFTSRRLAANKYEIEVDLLPGFEELPHQEQNRIGVIEAAPLLFSNTLADVKSTKIGRKTIYTVQWERPRSEILTRFVLIISFLFLAAVSFLFLNENIDYLIYCSVFIFLACVALLFVKQHFRYKELSQVHQIQTDIVHETIEKFYSDYRELTTLNEIGNIINKNNQLTVILKEISKLISSNFHKGAFFVSDNYKDYVSVQHFYGYSPKLENIKIDLNYLKNHSDTNKPILIDNRKSLGNIEPLKEYEPYFDESDLPLCWIPIIFDRSIIGFFFLTPNENILPIRQRDLHFLMGISSRIASGIHRLYAFASLVENDRIKSAFLTTASHELRTPVQIILLGLSKLMENPVVFKEAEKDLGIVQSGTLRLREIISNILDLNALETSKDFKINLHPAFEVLALIKPEMKNLAGTYNHLIFFDYDESILLRCDPSHLPTAIINLFSNSCKYTASGGKIFLLINDFFSETRIDIIDNGYGIDKDIQDKVFIRFFQSENAKNATAGGCGIGLSIADEIIKAHGGQITITSPLNAKDYPELGLSSDRRGTRARIHLPK